MDDGGHAPLFFFFFSFFFSFNALPLNLTDTAQLYAVAPFYTATDQGTDAAGWMTVDMHFFFSFSFFKNSLEPS